MFRSTRTLADDIVTYQQQLVQQRRRDVRVPVALTVVLVGIFLVLAAFGNQVAQTIVLIIVIAAYIWGCVKVELIVHMHGLCSNWKNSTFKRDYLGNMLFLGSWLSVGVIHMHDRRSGRLQRTR